MAIAPIRPASTVVVARERSADGPFEVLMVRRNDQLAFMAGAFVFPGGRVDEHDVVAAEGDTARAFRLAAIRELEEEAALTVDADGLLLFAHWITPEVETRRYDTRFFLALMPDDQHAMHDAGEMTEHAWFTPTEAIERCRRGEIALPPPTWTTLKRMERLRTLDELLAWARAIETIPAVQPQFLKTADQTMLTLPGDPTYPTIEGWEIPEETRFLLQDGRWHPVRP